MRNVHRIRHSFGALFTFAAFALLACDPGPTTPGPGDPVYPRGNDVCGYRTQNQFDWGADCVGGQPAAACLRDSYFGQVVNDGLILGCGYYTANLENSPAVELALPTSGKIRALHKDEVGGYDGVDDPYVGTAFFGHVAALGLNLEFDDLPAFNQNHPGTPLGELIVVDGDSPCAGMSIQDIFNEANAALGDCPTGLTAKELSACVSMINATFRDGTDLNGTPLCSDRFVEPSPLS